MNRILALLHNFLICALLCPLASWPDNVNGGVVFSEKSYSEILAQAKSEGKAVMIDCYTSWCVPCRKMAAEVFTQKELGEYINPRFVAAKFDMEKGEGVELRKRFDVNAYPTFLLLDADGNELGRVLGYKTADAFRSEVEKGMSGDSIPIGGINLAHTLFCL